MKASVIKKAGRRTAKLLAGAVLAAAVAAPSANALGVYRYWYSQSSPLIAYDGGQAQGAGYGQWSLRNISSGTKSIAFAYLKDYWPGGNYIYLEHASQSNSGYCIVPDYTSCTQQYYDGHRVKSSGSNSGSWVGQSSIANPDLSADYWRAKIWVCEEQRYSPNPCSGQVLTKGDTL